MTLEPMTDFEILAIKKMSIGEFSTEFYCMLKIKGLRSQARAIAECSGYDVNNITEQQAKEIDDKIILAHTTGRLNDLYLNPMQVAFFTSVEE